MDLKEIVSSVIAGDNTIGQVVINGEVYNIEELAELVKSVADLQSELTRLLVIKTKEINR